MMIYRPALSPFRENDVFERLHDTLVPHNGMTPTMEMISLEALPMFLWTVGGMHTFCQAKNSFEVH